MSKPILYLALGDSIGILRIDDLSSGSHFFNTKIRNAIRANYGQCKFINKHVSGYTTANIMANLGLFTNIVPDLVTIEIGMNDCNNQAVSVSAYTSNLNAIIDRLRSQNPNVKIILCTPSRTNVATRTPYIQAYRDAMTTVATNKNVSKCNFENAWTAGEDANIIAVADPHPNQIGQTALFNTIWPVVQSVL